MRADFYDPLIRDLGSILPAQQVTLTGMPREELKLTITEPARLVGLSFDPPAVVGQILADIGEDEGRLPLLQYALRGSWALRKGNTITADSYTRNRRRQHYCSAPACSGQQGRQPSPLARQARVPKLLPRPVNVARVISHASPVPASAVSRWGLPNRVIRIRQK